MRAPAFRRARHVATVAALGAGFSAVLVAAPSAPALAGDPVCKIQSMGAAPYELFLVKDLGGGAYWNVTTNAMYAVSAASAALITAGTTGQELVAQVSADGRTLLLLVNGAVLVPVGDKL
jgi:hypothetical protein